MPNAHKELVISDLRDIVTQSKGAILTDYRGLTVADVTNLRKKLRDVDAEYHIVKNTLFKIAVGEESGAKLDTLLTGPDRHRLRQRRHRADVQSRNRFV